ncbi:hypothetical protein PWT90_09878 [Aphanocladium album]|nr:hypothetical protein PWT90_09878 [Aphanocladium album]
MAFGLNTAWLILSKIPLLVKTIIFHTLSLSPTARKWDFRTEIVVTMLRDLLINSPASSISDQQALFMRDVPIRGKMWVSKVTLPAPPPEDGDVSEHLHSAVAALGTGREQYTKAPLQDVGGEWVGVRHGVSDSQPQPADMSERDKFDSLTEEAETDVTVLYIHGGANYLMDPVSTRPTALAYATYAKCRVFSVRYRLAPQGPFPSSVLDAFVAYLSLLHPPPGSWHKAVPASRLIVSGDSAGGNISMSLLQLLLQLHRAASGTTPTVRFHGRDVAVPLPAGVGLNSPSLDLTRSMQWSEEFVKYDYLPTPAMSPVTSPPCTIWPADPPRVHLYCDGSALAHPLVSPMAAASWDGAPPTFFVCGEELLTGEGKTVAQRMARQGVPVVWEQWEAMPHCFSLVLTWTEASRVSFQGWADFVKNAVDGKVETKGCYVSAKTLERKEVDVKSLTTVGHDDVLEGMAAARQRVEEEYAYLLA